MSNRPGYIRPDRQVCMGLETYAELQIIKGRYGITSTAFFDMMFSDLNAIDNLLMKIGEKRRKEIARLRVAKVGRIPNSKKRRLHDNSSGIE